MKFSILTIFPEMFAGFLNHGIVQKAIAQGLVETELVNIRDYATGRHRTTDDRPFGGGDGMVMKPEPLAAAIRAVNTNRTDSKKSETIFLSPQGTHLDQAMAHEISNLDHAVLICGRYEGIDERVVETLVDREISIGDYVLTGGELPAMVVMDAATRLIPGALGGEHSADTDSFATKRLSHSQYTRPRDFEGLTVPEILLSGDHKNIEQWRIESALFRTFIKRPGLLMQQTPNDNELELLKQWQEAIQMILNGSSDGLSRKIAR